MKTRGGLPRLSVFRATDVDDLARLAIDVGDVTLVIDELDMACAGKTWRSEAVKQIVQYGRWQRVDLFGTFRSTRNVNEDILGLSNYVFIFKHSDAAYWDLQALNQRFGPETGDEARRLEPFQFFVRSL